MLVAPSILSADFGRLNEEIDELNKTDCDYLHIDVMDGHFVPNLTFGNTIVEIIAKRSKKPLDIHLMVENVGFFIDYFIDIKPEFLSFHIEAERHINRTIHRIRDCGIKPGIVLNPHTSQESLEYILRYVDLVLLMSVNPGFGGQNFISSTLEKAIKLKEMIEEQNLDCLIQMDGGINDKNINMLKEAGVDIAVSGHYIFGSKNYQKAINLLR
ncbi:ribulose-phosphate 3-epimerase [Helicobacter sp. 16-1353]|uniref:ribulose-phosphate 3-epimerase n=1 Tax=Helicobacter sp. 16-1353 TaxID=2004996 RepID=UPI000DCE76C7|nr:ribulose-phosphate 3-epimerase [Helicobacter sp. 16-1353]RAX53887.1 ribulose-phosphate 3-epimerase [Helicobacter sp. 16-1353]